ncbi:Glucosyltransferase-like protein [Saitoella coloradoensis]
MPSMHKPRSRKPSPVIPRSTPLEDFFGPLQNVSVYYLILPIILLVTFLIRCAVGLAPYSGYQAPPMHGDFEAQRHWMEITAHLPLREWYFHDLDWWGLDYPPLTAYHSWLCGVIGNLIDPAWFELYTSRGLDEYNLKVFMRATALASEYLVYVPAVWVFVKMYNTKDTPADRGMWALMILLQPALILIDHAHFQYNAVMLGFTVVAMNALWNDQIVVGSVFFVAALCFKQMALYYAPAIFAYLLGTCVFPRLNLQRLVILGVTTLSTFAIFFAPLILTGTAGQAVFRIFPFARGLWEDKVANFWCTANTFIKFRTLFTSTQLQRLSLLATLVAILPPCVILFVYPRRRLLPLGLSASAWGFFLFSFQVHEKSVLLPLMPATLLLASSGNDYNRKAWVGWVNNVAVFSMWPLLRRDGVGLQYTVLLFMWNWLAGFWGLPADWFGKLVHVVTYVGMLGMHVAEKFFEPPAKWPDVWVLGNVTLSFGAFVVFWMWTLLRMWEVTRKPVVKEKMK